MHGGSTPTWDIALYCEVEGRPGLVLVEAKAHVSELSKQAKTLSKPDPKKPRSAENLAKSNDNHQRIGNAIAEAQASLLPLVPGVSISRDRHFQLSNRLAFAWKLASMRILTVLLYLGFTGDEDMRTPSRKPFTSDAHWQAEFRRYLTGVCPASALDAPLDLEAAKLWVLSRSRPVLGSSSAGGGRDATSAISE